MTVLTNYCASVLGENDQARESLRLIPQIGACSEELLDLIYRYSKPVDLKEGEVLIKEGLFDQWIYFILDGEMKIRIQGQEVGTTSGPLVGERCILGEPRGADLIAGKKGLKAFGIEMSIADDVQRQIIKYSRQNPGDEDLIKFTQEKIAIILELYSIVLAEVIGRIFDLCQTGVDTYLNYVNTHQVYEEDIEKLSRISKNSLQMVLSANTRDMPDSEHKLELRSFTEFSKKVYERILKDCTSHQLRNPLHFDEWEKVFKMDDDCCFHLKETLSFLSDEFEFSSQELVDLVLLIFEEASLYTADANRGIQDLLALFKEELKTRLRETEPPVEKQRDGNDNSMEKLEKYIFIPIAKRLANSENLSKGTSESSSKMSQEDINALFD